MRKSEDVSKPFPVREELKPYSQGLRTLKDCLEVTLFRFPFSDLKTHKIAFCIHVSAIFFTTMTSMFCTTREKLSWSFADRLVRVTFGLGNRCKNARWLNILRVPFLSRMPSRNKHWHKSNSFLSCKWRSPCPRFTARVPKFRSGGPKMNVV